MIRNQDVQVAKRDEQMRNDKIHEHERERKDKKKTLTLQEKY